MTTPNRPVIEVRDVVVQYERTVALDHVTLTVPRGRITALLGPNGAGKTTLVDLLEGFARPDAGTVEVLGRDPWRAPAEWRDRIGVVLQDTRLDADLSVAEFIDMLAMEVSPDTEWGSVLTLLSSGAGQVLVSFDITPEVRQGRGDERLIGRAQARSR